jgi:hypothetical protein
MSLTYPDIRFAGGPTYSGVLFPFTYSSGVVDLPSGWASGKTAAPANEGCQVRRLGGDFLVQSIGSNFKSYIYNVTNLGGYKVQNTTSIRVTLPGVVTKVQQLGTQNLPATISTGSFSVSTSAPTADFIQYNSSYAFDKPLVVQADAKPVGGGSTITLYITFYTQWDH